MFSSALYIGQTVGVAIGALVIDRFGAVPLFLGTAVALPILAVWFACELRKHRRVKSRIVNTSAETEASGRSLRHTAPSAAAPASRP